VAEQELDLFEVTAGLAAELSASPAQIVGTEVGDSDLSSRSLHHIPYRPVAQPVADLLAALADRAQESPLFDPGRGLPVACPIFCTSDELV